MNKTEATKLLALIKIAYPTAYRDMDDISKKATVNMWQVSFPDVPYALMESAFNHFRMVSKFPPTVAEMVEELKQLHYQATELALISKGLGDEERVKQYRSIMDCTYRFKEMDGFWGQVNGGGLPMIGGGSNGSLGLPGTGGGREEG